MATQVEYAGITLYNCLTKRWDQEMVYDQSGTDLLYSKFSLRFECVMHANDIALSPVYTARGSRKPTDLATLYEDVRSRLQQPRGTLRVWIGTGKGGRRQQSLLHVAPCDARRNDADRDNGPKPKHVSIERIAGSQVAKIAFEIEACLGECPTSQAGYGTVLNNRWSVRETINAVGWIAREIKGRLRISDATLDPQAVKTIVVPPLEPGFKREMLEFTVAPNGLDCEYVVLDRQIHTAAPWPATKLEMTHIESTVNGYQFVSDINVRLEGPPLASKVDMITQAIACACSRLDVDTLGELTSKNWKPEHIAIIDYIGEQNVVEFKLRLTHMTEADKTIASITKWSGKELRIQPYDGQAYDRTKSPPPPAWGWTIAGDKRRPGAYPAALAVLGCYLQSPCGDWHNIGRQNPAAGETYGAITAAEITSVSGHQSSGSLPTLPKNDNYSQATMEHLYSLVKVESRFLFENLQCVLPIAGRGSRDDDTCAIIDLAGGQCRRVIHVEGERVGAYPELPEPVSLLQDGALRGVLLWRKEYFSPPLLAVDGVKKIFRCEVQYCYAYRRPPRKDESTRVGQFNHMNYVAGEDQVRRDKLYASRLKV